MGLDQGKQGLTGEAEGRASMTDDSLVHLLRGTTLLAQPRHGQQLPVAACDAGTEKGEREDDGRWRKHAESRGGNTLSGGEKG